MNPYFEEDGITIYHADARDFMSFGLPEMCRRDESLTDNALPSQELRSQSNGDGPKGSSVATLDRSEKPGPVAVIITDPPYGIEGMKHSLSNRRTSKGDYDTDEFEDSKEYLLQVVIPTIAGLRSYIPRCVLTPGQVNIHKYPAPDHMGAFFYPASTSISRWGMRLWQPIFYYGKDPYQGALKPDGKICYDSDRLTDHPCPKPLDSWSWLVQRSSLTGETILDPFAGSGTSLLAAKNTHRRAIGIEIEEKYCEIAAKRLSQKVFQF